MDLHAQTCHVIRRMTQKLEIPKFALLPVPCQPLVRVEMSTIQIEHLNILRSINKILFQLARSGMPEYLFKPITSVRTPGNREAVCGGSRRQCCFDAHSCDKSREIFNRSSQGPCISCAANCTQKLKPPD